MLPRLRNYSQLRSEDRVTLAGLKQQCHGIRAVALVLNHPPSAIKGRAMSRPIKRDRRFP